MTLTIEYGAIGPDRLEEMLHEALPEEWSRDGILEHQITTQDPVQFCFRRRSIDEIPRATICLSGTDETLADAAVVPVDRGPELSEVQKRELLRDFAEHVLEPALVGVEGATVTISDEELQD